MYNITLIIYFVLVIFLIFILFRNFKIYNFCKNHNINNKLSNYFIMMYKFWVPLKYWIKPSITEKDHLEKEWYKEAKNQTLKTLPKFINHIMNDYKHDYGTICKAISACMIATMNACNKEPQGGITGFQASCIMWEIIPILTTIDDSAGLKLVSYSNMLYPQYRDNFEKTISSDTFKQLQSLAKKYLEENSKMHPLVKEHMEKIVNGEIPFGYKINDNIL